MAASSSISRQEKQKVKEEFKTLMKLDPLNPVDIATFQKNQDVFQELLKKNPRLARKRNGLYKGLALHQVAACSSSPTVVQAVLNINPRAASQKLDNQDGGWTPLHMACRFNTLETIILLLLKAFPKAAAIRLKDGATALHLVCKYHEKSSAHVIEALLKAFPEATRKIIKTTGLTPLHYACQYHQSQGVIQSLLEEYPEAATVKSKTSGGWTPLHVACRYNDDQVIDLLLKEYPEAAKMTVDGGWTPLNLVCARLLPENAASSEHTDVIQALLHKNPKAVAIKNKHDKTPIDYARENGASDEIIATLQGTFTI